MATIILISAITVMTYMSLCWLYSLSIKRSDIADVAWGMGFVTLTSALMIRFGTSDTKSWLLLTMVSLWGLRLATHIAARHHGKPEDSRYQDMRKTWKWPKLQSYTNVFILQGFFLLLVSTPLVLFFLDTNHTIKWFNYIGLLVWAIGLVFESVGDYQLVRFKSDAKNKGKVMRFGLWRYTRHPNYFGEISLWWGIYLFTLFTPYWYVGLIGPITITYLIIGVSGIPMLERKYKGNAAYEDYQKTTSAFFPLPSKQK